MKLIVVKSDVWTEYNPVVKYDEHGELKVVSGSVPSGGIFWWTSNGASTIDEEVIPCCEIDGESTKTMFVMPEANDDCLPVFICANCASKMEKLIGQE